jgi:O-antigen/teichoic acid export membrane protein
MRLLAARVRVLKIGSANKGFVGSVLVLASGTAAGQAIIIVGSPLLLRLYTPDQFGVFGVYLAIVSIAAIAVTLRYEAALPLPDSEEEALDVPALTLLATACISVFAGLAVWLVAVDVIVVTITSAIRSILWLVPLGLLFAGLQQTLTLWATRLAAFGASARSSVAGGGAQAASQMILGIPRTGGMGLAIGYLLGRVGAIRMLVTTISSSQWRMLRGTELSSTCVGTPFQVDVIRPLAPPPGVAV